MFKPNMGKPYVGNSDALKHLKIGDVFNVQSSKNAAQSFTVLRADIVHSSHPDIACANDMPTPTILTLTSNYPFGRLAGDTPLRYVVYATLAH